MEEVCSYETSTDFQLTTRRYIPEDSTFHNESSESLKSYMHGTLLSGNIGGNHPENADLVVTWF
jgi:hypothetical protein